MNKIRRKELARIVAKLEELEALREEIQSDLEIVMELEQDALDNMPESFQETERGEQMQEYIDTMDGVVDELDCMSINDLVDQLREISEV